MSIRSRALALLAALGLAAAAAAESPQVVIGSKKFTESVILGEIMAQLVEEAGALATHRRELGGSRILYSALLSGDLDAYPEYTGTLRQELLAELNLKNDAELAAALSERGLRMSAPLGFNNTYAIGMRSQHAERLGIATISDLRDHPDLALGFGNEFMDRGDGWPALQRAYDLPHTSVRGMDHDLGYRALIAGDIAAMDLYSTDAEIAYYDLAVLDDDRAFFPRYDAVILYRADLAQRAPAVLASILRVEGRINEPTMIQMNQLAKIGRAQDGDEENRTRVPAPIVAQEFLRSEFGVQTNVRLEGTAARLLRTTREQAILVAVSMAAATMIAIPLGVLAARGRAIAPVILGAVGILQTIPALALLVLLIKPFGLTDTTAIVALFLYSLLPIVRNTHAGLAGVRADLLESADAIGLTSLERLRLIELPIALPTILAGIKTAAVINVGTATLAALIGAGGYGQPILTGIRLDDFGLILQGAVPAAIMAIAAQLLFDGLERLIVSRGLRL